MEQVENPMIMPELQYNTNWEKYYEAMAEREDREWEEDLND